MTALETPQHRHLRYLANRAHEAGLRLPISDEVMIVTIACDHDDRKRSYERIARAFQPNNPI